MQAYSAPQTYSRTVGSYHALIYLITKRASVFVGFCPISQHTSPNIEDAGIRKGLHQASSWLQ